MSFSTVILSFLFNFIFFVQVISSIATTAIKLNEYVVDRGKNITIPCRIDKRTVMWIKDDDTKEVEDLNKLQENGSLTILNVTLKDSGIYTCFIIPSSPTRNNEETSQEIEYPADTIINETNSLLEFFKAKIKVKTEPSPVKYLTARITTIIGVLQWDILPNHSGYPLIYFSAEYREYDDSGINETEWVRVDPKKITPNARQVEIYGLIPNTTYEFRIWSTNALGPGEKTSYIATTLPEMEEKDLIRLIEVDAKNFDTRIWIVAVSVVLGTLTILSIGTSLLLCKECRDPPVMIEEELDSVELVPNIILNPGFCDSDDQRPTTLPFSNTIYDEEEESDAEQPMTFKRRISYFFTGDSIKRL